ncbi:hypothetical protein MA16_Dca028499 [Dendrobium catenatum]|uniref:Uncharacterized protein n=1 Tax=Dendrobium catenatum TaxID=906689 RepID=A0A2I0VBL1_9ASPA|nr:hypothetical protein MA16_Dca028499 [Dendrobium catenatum]
MAATQRKKIPRFLWWFGGLRGSRHRVVAPWRLDNNPFHSRTFGQHIENLGQQFLIFESAGQQDIHAGISGQQEKFQEGSSSDTGQQSNNRSSTFGRVESSGRQVLKLPILDSNSLQGKTKIWLIR